MWRPLYMYDRTLINYFSNVKYFTQNEINWNAYLMQLGYFIDVFLAWHVSGTYAHHQEH